MILDRLWSVRFPAELRLEVRNELAALALATERLDEFWLAHDVDADAQADLNIAIEEILSNVMRHGQAGRSGIQLAVAVNPDVVRVEIRDRGRPFNPLALPPPDVRASLEERRGGGLGVYMATRLMDETSYERQAGRNCFRMVKHRQPSV